MDLPTINISSKTIYLNAAASNYLGLDIQVNVALDALNGILYLIPDKQGRVRVYPVNRGNSGRIKNISFYDWLQNFIVNGKYYGQIQDDGSLSFEVDMKEEQLFKELLWYEDEMDYKIKIEHDGFLFGQNATAKLNLPCKIAVSIDEEAGTLIISRHPNQDDDESLLDVKPYNKRAIAKHPLLENFFAMHGSIKLDTYKAKWDEEEQSFYCDIINK